MTSPKGANLLVIGYGNDLCGDDGLGPHLARTVSGWNRPGLEVKALAALGPEVAALMAGMRLVLFVDARIDRPRRAVEVRRLQPTFGPNLLGHAYQPASLLGLTRGLYGLAPESWSITVAGYDFALGESLSAPALANGRLALARIDKILARFEKGA